ncbi:MAG: hypothetical protein JJ931_06035 [Henriciella sp.]|nr:hypothetical protein [Henriciella sp.]MBO6694957.1 hypothetical protein [Henriciella sp.]
MDLINLRQLANLTYHDPEVVLKKLREIEYSLPPRNTTDLARRLRTNGLKSWHETRLAAVFCVGMTSLIGLKIWFAHSENQDYDFVTMWREDESTKFCPVQLKEVAPHDLNPHASIEDVFQSLRRYGDSSDLVVAVSISQQTTFDPSCLKIPKDLTVKEFWVFGTLAPDQSKWALWGDFTLGDRNWGHTFDYPSE